MATFESKYALGDKVTSYEGKGTVYSITFYGAGMEPHYSIAPDSRKPQNYYITGEHAVQLLESKPVMARAICKAQCDTERQPE